jgi:hypothetical protein
MVGHTLKEHVNRRSLVFGVPVRDPLTFTGVAMVLAGVALAA